MQIDELIQSKADIKEEKINLEQLQHQFTVLREQFEDKSEALDRARKDLFTIENDFLLLQKTWEESNLAPSEEVLSLCRDIKVLEEECMEMQNQIFFFQDLVSSLLDCKN
jgi:chromosome segregation ATPase